MPQQIVLSGGRNIKNTYAADGRKLFASATENNQPVSDGTRYYNGNLVFDINGELEYILMPEGRILNNNGTYEYEYHLKDHLGSVRVAFTAANNTKTVVQENAYYPFGAPIGDLSYAAPLNNNRYGYTGQEQLNDFDLNWYDYIARNYNPLIGRFNSIDPLAEEYYGISPYAYCANNPVNAVDFNGDSITIVHRTGFLGLGGKETLTYENGNLFNSDGSAYTGKVKGYLKSAVGALGSLNATTEGAALVSELQNSTNMFTIKNGSNHFKANSISKAGANLAEVQAVTGNTTGSSGSGGTIYWNNSTNGGLDLAGGTARPAYIGLGHEMGHASDANQGLLHYGSMDQNGNVIPSSYTNIVSNITYNYVYNGLLKSEWRAVYRENLIRGQAGIPLRTHYGINMSTGVPIGIGPRLLSPLNRPLNYP